MPGKPQSLSSYPLTQAVNKHDLLCVRGGSDSSSPLAVVFTSTPEMFKKVISYDDKDFLRNGKPEQKGFVYSYKDGPEYPGVSCLFSCFILSGRLVFASNVLVSLSLDRKATNLFRNHQTELPYFGRNPSLCLG